MNLEQLYASIGGDYQDAIEKYGSDDKVLRYLRILLKGDSLQQLEAALEAQDAQAAFASAHSLKGTTGNMSLGRMFELFSQMTEEFRQGNIGDQTKVSFAEAKQLYTTLAAAIASWE